MQVAQRGVFVPCVPCRCREGGRPREAAAHYQSVLELWEEAEAAEAAAGRTGTGGAAAAKATAAAAAAAEEAGDGDQGAGPGRPPTPADQRRVRLSLAACLYDIPGQEAGGAGGGGVAAAALPYSSPELRDLAASLVMAVLEEDAADWDALYLYGRCVCAASLLYGRRVLWAWCSRFPRGVESLRAA